MGRGRGARRGADREIGREQKGEREFQEEAVLILGDGPDPVRRGNVRKSSGILSSKEV